MHELETWAHHQRLVMDALERGQSERKQIMEDLVQMRIEVARLKTIASLSGGVAGTIAGALGHIMSTLVG